MPEFIVRRHSPIGSSIDFSIGRPVVLGLDE